MTGSAAPDEGADGDQKLIGRLFAPAARADPYAFCRDAALPGCRHAVALTMLKDSRLGPPVLGLETAEELMWRTFARWLLNLDGDRHRPMRQRFARIFTAARVRQYRSAIEACAHPLIDSVATSGQMDLVSDFARPLPFRAHSTAPVLSAQCPIRRLLVLQLISQVKPTPDDKMIEGNADRMGASSGLMIAT